MKHQPSKAAIDVGRVLFQKAMREAIENAEKKRKAIEPAMDVTDENSEEDDKSV